MHCVVLFAVFFLVQHLTVDRYIQDVIHLSISLHVFYFILKLKHDFLIMEFIHVNQLAKICNKSQNYKIHKISK